jgi:hypothetical protein
MDFLFKFNLEFILLFGFIYLILATSTFCSCCYFKNITKQMTDTIPKPLSPNFKSYAMIQRGY